MNKRHLFVLLPLVMVLFSILPAFAEVTSLKTSAPFYKGGSMLHFSGTVLDTDPPNVTILIFDPNNKFIMLTSGLADSTHQFQISVDTSNPDNQQKFSIKGTYNATAFIANKDNGKTVSFIFSPDGSPVIPSPPTSLTASVQSSTEIDLKWSAPVNTGGTALSGYKVERSADRGSTWSVVAPNVVNTVTSYPDTGLTPATIYSYRVYAVNPAGASSPSNVVTASTVSSPTQTTTTTTPAPSTDQSSPSLDELLKQRMADAKRLQELLNGKTSSPVGVQQSIALSENMGVGDMASSLANSSSPITNQVSSPPVNFGNVLYPGISLVGVGIVVAILYLRKKQKIAPRIMQKEIIVPEASSSKPVSDEKDEDYAMMILKNRLAKGEITLEQFQEIKDELLEP